MSTLRPIRPKYTAIRGDTFYEALELLDADGDKVTASGWTWRFTVRDSIPATSVTDDSGALIAAFGSFTGGDSALEVSSDDMEIDVGDYFFDFQLRKPDGSIHSTTRGDFIIEGDITRETDES